MIKVGTSLLLVMSWLMACQHEEPVPEITISGLFNGVIWEQPGWAFQANVRPNPNTAGRPCDSQIVDLTIKYLNPQQYLRQNLFVQSIPTGRGRHPLYRHPVNNISPCRENVKVGAKFFLLGSDGDVLRAVFDVVESADNFIEVERFDEQAGRVEGRLQATFTALPENRSLDTPYDTIRITDCRFSIPLRR